MIRLAFAIAFLSVFGIVAYAIIHLLKDYFNKKQTNKNEH